MGVDACRSCGLVSRTGSVGRNLAAGVGGRFCGRALCEGAYQEPSRIVGGSIGARGGGVRVFWLGHREDRFCSCSVLETERIRCPVAVYDLGFGGFGVGGGVVLFFLQCWRVVAAPAKWLTPFCRNLS